MTKWAASLARLNSLKWLSAKQLKRLDAAMAVYEVEHDELIFSDDGRISDVFILLSGAARLVCVGVKRGRIVSR